MSYFTEKELLNQQTIDFDYCSLLEKDGIVSLDDLGDLIPGHVHLNDRKTSALDYLSQRGLEIFEKTIEEIRQGGSRFVHAISDKRSHQIFEAKRNFFTNPETRDATFSYVQRLHYDVKKIPYKLFYTTSKPYKDGRNIISFTQPLQILQGNSFLKEIVEERYVFFNNNYFRFNLLTKREREILSLIAEGDDNRKIGERLFISPNTVKTHRKNICNKLETGKLIELVKYARVFLSIDF